MFIRQVLRAKTTMIFVDLTVAIMENTLSWGVKPNKSLLEVVDRSKMTVHIYQTIRCYIPEDGYLLNRGGKKSLTIQNAFNCTKMRCEDINWTEMPRDWLKLFTKISDFTQER